MLHYLRARSASLLVASLLLFSAVSCKKKEETVAPVPEDLSGSLDATFSPAGSVSSISLSQQGSAGIVTYGYPDATGYLKLTSIQPGNYVVTFTKSNDYLATSPRNVTITAKANTALGTINVDRANTSVPYSLQGTAGWTSTLTASGATTTATNAATTGNLTFYNGTPISLSLTAIYQSGTTAETVKLYTSYAGVGQYTLGAVTGAGSGSYLRTVGGATTNSYDTAVGGPQGTLTVTAHDLTKRTITGTFGFNGYDGRSSVKSVAVTSGTFSVSY